MCELKNLQCQLERFAKKLAVHSELNKSLLEITLPNDPGTTLGRKKSRHEFTY